MKDRRAAVFFLIAILTFVNITGLQKPATAASTSQRIKLVVFLIADQFPSNYFLHCAENFQANGLKQLIDNGANFTACRYSGATNQTACNLTSIVTGADPWATGIVGNEWYDRHKQKTIRATLDEENTVGTDENGNAANTMLLGTTIGDELKIATNGLSHVVSVSTSASDAMILAGKSRDQAFWWDSRLGSFSGQSRLNKTVPNWTQKFNEKHYSEQFLGKSWQPSWRTSVFASTDNYDLQAKADIENAFGRIINNGSKTADESFYTKFLGTPWANQMLIDFATEAIDHELLGQHDTVDMLNISFPAFEIVGKNYGPYSQEAHDLVWRFDQSLSVLLEGLDKKIGLSNCLIIFTAGHGAPASLQAMQKQGIDAGIIDATAFCNQLNSALSSKLTKSNWIEAFTPPNLYLNLNAIDHSNYRQPDVEKLTAKLGRSISGVAEIYTAFQLFMNEVPTGPQVDMIRKSYFWGRSGELYVIPKPGFVFTSESDGIAGGSPYSYDAQVPLIMYGSPIKAGAYAGLVSPDDIAPTVANILSICPPPLIEGRVLNEALNVPLNASIKSKYSRFGK